MNLVVVRFSKFLDHAWSVHRKIRESNVQVDFVALPGGEAQIRVCCNVVAHGAIPIRRVHKCDSADRLSWVLIRSDTAG